MEPRYQSVSCSGAVIASGPTIGSVEGFGKRLVIDRKLHRWFIQGIYPGNVHYWKHGLGSLGDVIRRLSRTN